MINIKTPVSTDIGYGIVGFNLIKNIILTHNEEVCYFPIGQPRIPQEYQQLFQQIVNNQNNYNPNISALTIWHEHSIHERIGKGKNCALSFFEVDILNTRQKRNIETHDVFICSSKWMEQIIHSEVDIYTTVIAMGVDTDFFKPVFIQFPEDKPYTFLTVGKLEVRKGHDILHEIFNKAFTKEDNVKLLIAWDSPFISIEERQKWENMYKQTPLGDKIEFIPRIEDIRQLYAYTDCCIFPTRAEAICLPALEAMACNKPVIITNYSGPTEFCNSQNSYLVNIDEKEAAFDGIWFHGDANWAKLGDNQIEQFIEYMRFCYKTRMNINPLGRSCAESLDWKNVTKKLLEILI